MNRYEGQKFDLYVCDYFKAKVQSSIDRGIDFDLSLSDVKRLLSKKLCTYSKLAMTHSGCNNQGGSRRFTDLTLERKDNTKGYTKENTIAVCHGFNNIKSTFENPNHPVTIKHLKKFAKAL